MRSLFLPKCNPITKILPYQTNKDRSTFFGDFLVSVGSFFGYDPCLFVCYSLNKGKDKKFHAKGQQSYLGKLLLLSYVVFIFWTKQEVV